MSLQVADILSRDPLPTPESRSHSSDGFDTGDATDPPPAATVASPTPLDRLRTAGLPAFFRPSQLDAAGLTRDQLPALVRSGGVEQVARGLYRLADAEPTENYSRAMACAKVPNSILCLLTALRIHEIGTQQPPAVWLAIPHKARAPRPFGLRLEIVRFSGAAWTLGVDRLELEGVPVRLTNPARTIVDCFRYERLLGPEPPMEALLDGLRRRKVTVAELSRINDVLPSRRLSAVLDTRSL